MAENQGLERVMSAVKTLVGMDDERELEELRARFSATPPLIDGSRARSGDEAAGESLSGRSLSGAATGAFRRVGGVKTRSAKEQLSVKAKRSPPKKEETAPFKWVGHQTSIRTRESGIGNARFDSLTEFALGLGRGFALGFGAKSSLALAFSVLRNPKNISKIVRSVFSADALHFGIFCGMYAGSYRGLYCWLTKLRGVARRDSSFIAGAISGLAILFDTKSRRLSVALFLLVRALDAAVKRLVRGGILPYWKHFVSLMFGVFNMPIMYSFLFKPHLIGEGYYRWILGMGAMDHKGLQYCLRDVRDEYYSSGKLLPFRQCQEGYHIGETCVRHGTLDWFKGIGRAAKIYIPVHLVPLILFNSRRLAKDPVGQAVRLGKAVAMSSAFLSTYVFCVKMTQCTLRNANKFDHGWHALLGGLTTGLATYFERPGRVSELMLFCAPKGLTAAWKYFSDEVGIISAVPNGEVPLFCLASALFMSASSKDVKASYMSAMRLLMGLS